MNPTQAQPVDSTGAPLVVGRIYCQRFDDSSFDDGTPAPRYEAICEYIGASCRAEIYSDHVNYIEVHEFVDLDDTDRVYTLESADAWVAQA